MRSASTPPRPGQAFQPCPAKRTRSTSRSARTISRNRIPSLAQLPNYTQELKSLQLKSTEVIVRFGLRMIVLGIFAAFGSIGFERSLTALLWMSTILSAVLAALESEQPLDAALNHWDETMAYAALCCLVSGFDPVPI